MCGGDPSNNLMSSIPKDATEASSELPSSRISIAGAPPGPPAHWRLGFWSLIVTQFQGAFNDNALKWLVSFMVLAMGLEQVKRDFLFVLVVPLLFSIPFLLFSMTGGYLADRFSKRSVTAGLKIM